jgi:dienelactone hydrolase
MKFKILLMSFMMSILASSARSAEGKIAPTLIEQSVTYQSGDVKMTGFVAYDSKFKGKRPVVLIVHEWWGLNDYVKMRARKLAEMGYLAMAVDMFGDGKVAKNPDEAKAFTGVFYSDPNLSKARFQAALDKIKEFGEADEHTILAIGYCFGGSVVLNAAKLGVDLKGVVSFHGGLAGAPADKKLLKAKILVCHGGADKFVSDKDVSNFKHQMDSIGADYSFKVYANATHAFTNPESDENAKKFGMPIAYNPEADKASWEDMKTFFAKVLKK